MSCASTRSDPRCAVTAISGPLGRPTSRAPLAFRLESYALSADVRPTGRLRSSARWTVPRAACS